MQMGLITQFKPLVGIDLITKQTFNRTIKLNKVVEQHLSQLYLRAIFDTSHVGDQPILLVAGLNVE